LIRDCVNPKNTTTALPRKSASVRGLPVWSVSAESCPNDAPVVSAARNFWPQGAQAAMNVQTATAAAKLADGPHHRQ
jgi:hypothetical protein